MIWHGTGTYWEDHTGINVTELDDGKIETGNPDQFDAKNPWVSGRFSLKPIH